jgi:hypothetical protein
MGPFLDINNKDIETGDLYYQNTDQSRVYVTHEQIFKDLINTIHKELNGIKTKVILIPSHKDLHHFEPLPQCPFPSWYFPSSQYPSFHSFPNPSTLQLNDLKIGLINADIIKDLCSCMLPKNMEPPKIDLSLRAIMEQRSFYPLYPGN